MGGTMGGGREWEQWETMPNNAVFFREDKDLDDDKGVPFLLPIVIIGGGGGGGGGEGDQQGGTTGVVAGASPLLAMSSPLSGPASLP
jgi:hypothetical protein